MDSDPYLSAVVSLRPDRQPAGDEATVENPGGVAGEADAILSGANPSEPSSASRAVSADDVAVPSQGGALARSKAYFTKAGFEVHAPLGALFSIGNRKSRFETFFGKSLVLDEDRLGGGVTTEDGGQELPLEPLPDELREWIESISLPPPPDLPGGP